MSKVVALPTAVSTPVDNKPVQYSIDILMMEYKRAMKESSKR